MFFFLISKTAFHTFTPGEGIYLNVYVLQGSVLGFFLNSNEWSRIEEIYTDDTTF